LPKGGIIDAIISAIYESFRLSSYIIRIFIKRITAIALQCQLKIDPTPSLSLELFPANISPRLSKIPYMSMWEPGTMEGDVTVSTGRFLKKLPLCLPVRYTMLLLSKIIRNQIIGDENRS
jgi:hypothetical protein